MINSGVRLLYGEDAYLLEKRIEDILEEVRTSTGQEPECLFIDGEEIGGSELIEMLQFTPLFSAFRVIVIRRPHWFGQPGTKAARGMASVKELLESYLEKPNPYQVVLITSTNMAAGNPLVKVFKKKGLVEEFKQPGTQELTAWIADEFKRRGITIEGKLLRQLATSGSDMFGLQNQIEKISLCFGKGKLTLADAEDLIDSYEELKIFKLTDALLRRDVTAAYAALQKLFIQGQPPVLMVYMITRQFLLMAKVKSLGEAAQEPGEIARSVGLKQDFVVRKMLTASKAFTWAEIEAIFSCLLEVDTVLKGAGRPDEKTLLEYLLVNICAKQLNPA